MISLFVFVFLCWSSQRPDNRGTGYSKYPRMFSVPFFCASGFSQSSWLDYRPPPQIGLMLIASDLFWWIVIDADAVTPRSNTRSYTRQSVPSSLGRSFLNWTPLNPTTEIDFKRGLKKTSSTDGLRDKSSIALDWYNTRLDEWIVAVVQFDIWFNHRSTQTDIICSHHLSFLSHLT